MPFLGILQPKCQSEVPGTVILDDKVDAAAHEAGLQLSHRNGDSSIVLVPQPSADPNDPLNWSQWRKIAAMIIILTGTLLYACVSVVMTFSPAYLIATDLDFPPTTISRMAGQALLIMGATAPFTSAISHKYGKRALFVSGSVFHLVGTILCMVATNRATFHAGRLISALALAPYETLIFVVVGDLFFLHERGFWSAVSNFVLAGASNLAAVVSGSVSDALGWRALFHILLALNIAHLLALFLFVPETTFRRISVDEESRNFATSVAKQLGDQPNGTNIDIDSVADKPDTDIRKDEPVLNPETTRTTVEVASSVPAKKTFVQRLALFTGTYDDRNLVRLFIAVFVVQTNPVIIYTMLLQGWTFTQMGVPQYVMFQIFGQPPYNLSASAIGYVSLGGFTGCFISLLVCGWPSDLLIRALSRHNKGIYEPEFRLILALTGFLSPVGLAVFGYVTQEGKSPYVAATSMGLSYFGIVGLTIATSTYVIDTYRDVANEAFIMGLMYKAFLSYGFSLFINDMVAEKGTMEVFGIWAATVGAFLLPVCGIYIFGKRLRAWSARKKQ